LFAADATASDKEGRGTNERETQGEGEFLVDRAVAQAIKDAKIKISMSTFVGYAMRNNTDMMRI
jgi:hypothetical protein